MWRRIERTEACMRSKIAACVMVDMRRSIIHNQMNPVSACPPTSNLPQSPDEVFVIIRLKAAGPHLSIKDIQSHQQVHRALSFVLKLIARNLPRAHFLRGLEAGERLNVRFLVNTNQHIALLVQVPNLLVAPQNLRRTSSECFINGRGLPITTAMRLQTRLSQDARHRRIVNRLHDGLRDDYLLERATIPTCHLQSISARVSARNALDRYSFQRGKKRLGGHSVPGHRWPRRHAPDVVAITPTNWCGLSPTRAQSLRFVRHDPMPTRHGLGWPPVELSDLRWPLPVSSGDLSYTVCIRQACVLSFRSLPLCKEAMSVKVAKSIGSEIYAPVH